MLTEAGGSTFTVGKSKYDLGRYGEEDASGIFLRIAFHSMPQELQAQLDTGAPWSVLNYEVATEIGLTSGAGQAITLSTRLGRFHGTLERTSIKLVAEEGFSCEIEATVFVSEQWTADTFLGYSGFLERLRLAIDPQTRTVHFGQLGDAHP